MNNKIICFFLLFTLAGLTCLSAQMTKAQLQNMYVTYLRGQGYNPSVDSDGDVNFTAQNQRFYINVRENDLQSFQLVMTNFLDIGNQSNRLKALNAASVVTRTRPVARLYIASNGKIAIDTFILLTKPEDFNVHLNRLVTIMVQSREEFLEVMKQDSI